jgi:outer membrane protein TolC
MRFDKTIMPFYRKFIQHLLPSVPLLLIMGCASSERSDPLPFSDAAALTTESKGAYMDERWWTAFEDPDLNAAVERAMRSNFTIQSAFERMQAARALARRQSAEILPEVNLIGDGQISESLNSSNGGTRHIC